MDIRRFLGSCPPPPDRVDGWARCKVCDAPLRSDGLGCTGPVRHETPTTLRLYATWTGTLANLHAMHAHGIRLIVGPDQLYRMRASEPPPLAWAMDNGAFRAWQQAEPWNPATFIEALRRWGRAADFIVAPDVVTNAAATLERSAEWLPRIREYAELTPVYLAVQNGMQPQDFEARDTDGVYLPTGERFDGIFVGGSTEWKEATMHSWGALADACGVRMHVGRVNSARRIRLAIDAGASSVDGTSVTRFSINAAPLAAAAATARHPALPMKCHG